CRCARPRQTPPHVPRRRPRADARRVRLHAARRRVRRLPGAGVGAQPGRAHRPHVAVTRVTLYGRPGCHLCDEARESLQRVQTRAPFTIEEVDITIDDALHARYLERIPVISLDGVDLFDYEVDEDALERLILYREGG